MYILLATVNNRIEIKLHTHTHSTLNAQTFFFFNSDCVHTMSASFLFISQYAKRANVFLTQTAFTRCRRHSFLFHSPLNAQTFFLTQTAFTRCRRHSFLFHSPLNAQTFFLTQTAFTRCRRHSFLFHSTLNAQTFFLTQTAFTRCRRHSFLFHSPLNAQTFFFNSDCVHPMSASFLFISQSAKRANVFFYLRLRSHDVGVIPFYFTVR